MDDVAIPKLISDRTVAFYGTLNKSAAEIGQQASFQRNSKNPKFFEIVSFEDTPIAFHSFAVLPPQVCLTFRDFENLKFKSETTSESQELPIAIFARTIDLQGQREYKQCAQVAIEGCSWRVFVLEIKNPFVDQVMIVGAVTLLSYAIFKRDEGLPDNLRMFSNNCKDAIYYGNSLLDFEYNSTLHMATQSINESSHNTLPHEKEHSSNNIGGNTNCVVSLGSLDIALQPKASLALLIDELQIVPRVRDALAIFKTECDRIIADESNQKEGYESLVQSLETLFWRSKSYFDPQLLHEHAIALAQVCWTRMKFSRDDWYTKILRVLLRDEKIALACINNFGLADGLVQIFLDNKWSKQLIAIEIVLDLLFHYRCAKRFMTNDGSTESLYSRFYAAISSSPIDACNLFSSQLKEIDLRLQLYVAIRDCIVRYNELKGVEGEKNYQGLADAVQLVGNLSRQSWPARHESLLGDPLKCLDHYSVSYLASTGMVQVISMLVVGVHEKLGAFPAPCLDVEAIFSPVLEIFLLLQDALDLFEVSKRIKGALEYANSLYGNVQGGDATCDFINGGLSEINLVIQKTSFARFLLLIARKNCVDSAIGQIYEECTQNKTHQVFAKLLKQPVCQMLLDLVSELVICNNMGLAQVTHVLVCLLSDVLENDDAGQVLYFIGHPFLGHLEKYCQVANNSQRQRVGKVLDKLRGIYGNLHPSCIPYHTCKAVLDALPAAASISTKRSSHPTGFKLSLPSVVCNHKMGLTTRGKYGPSSVRRMVIEAARPGACSRDVVSTYTGTQLETIELFWGDGTIDSERSCILGIPLDEVQTYRKCRLDPLVPARPQSHLIYLLKLLTYTMMSVEHKDEAVGIGTDMVALDPFFGSWAKVLGAITPDLDTWFHTALGTFGSLLGYEWNIDINETLQLLLQFSKIAYNILYTLAHSHIVWVHGEMTDQGTDGNDGLELGYYNESLLKLLILTSTQSTHLLSWNEHENVANECLVACGKAVEYWYRRFKKSRRWLIHQLMTAYCTLPNMVIGVGYLICMSKCVDFFPSTLLQVHAVVGDGDDEDEAAKRGNIVSFYGGFYKYWTENVEMLKVSKLDKIPLDLLMEFICTVASRMCTWHPGALAFNAQVGYLLLRNGLPIDTFIKAVASQVSTQGSTSHGDTIAHRLVYFYKVALHLFNYDGAEPPARQSFCVTLDALEFYARVHSNGPKNLLLEGYLEIFVRHNCMWANSLDTIAAYTEFFDYMGFISSATRYITSTVDAIANSKANLHQHQHHPQSPRQSHGTSSLPTSASLGLNLQSALIGLESLKAVFATPFTTMACLYNFTHGTFETVVRTATGKGLESEKGPAVNQQIHTVPAPPLSVANVIVNLLERLDNGDSDDDIVLSCLECIVETCSLIHTTGAYQDGFLYTLVHGSPKKIDEPLFQQLVNVLESYVVVKSAEKDKDSVELSKIARALLLQHSAQGLSETVVPREIPKGIPSQIVAKQGKQWHKPKGIVYNVFSQVAQLEADLQRQILAKYETFMVRYTPEYDPFGFDSTLGCINKRMQVVGKCLFADLHAPKAVVKRPKITSYDHFKWGKSTSSRAPSKHVDEFDYEKAAAKYASLKGWSQEAIAKLACNITVQHWADLEQDLGTRGINLKSLVTNPMQLKDAATRFNFCQVIAKHTEISDLLLTCGLSVA